MSELKNIPYDKLHELTLKILDNYNFDSLSDSKELADSYYDKYLEVYNYLYTKTKLLKSKNIQPSEGYNVGKNKNSIF